MSTESTAWVALLRGVNVGGITIRSADLAELFRDLPAHDVVTILASGNVRFRAPGGRSERAALKTRIEVALKERFGYDAWIVLVTHDEMLAALEHFPFDAGDDARQPWVVFCVDDATQNELMDAAASLDSVLDPVAAGPGVVYWNPPKGRSTDTPFAKVLAKRRYKASTTNRNLRTLAKIAASA